MALPFLPCEHIEPAFRIIEGHVSNDIEHQLTTYILDNNMDRWTVETVYLIKLYVPITTSKDGI